MPSTTLGFSAERLYQAARKQSPLWKALGWALSYGFFVGAFRLLMLTFVTYFVLSSGANAPRFDDVSDALATTELTFIAFGAFLFLVLGHALKPTENVRLRDYISAHRLEAEFFPGFAQGSLLATGVVLAFFLAGVYRYLGAFLQFEESPWAVGGSLLRALNLFVLVYCEEILFRERIQNLIRQAPIFARFQKESHNAWRDLALCALVSFLFCSIKVLQFDLGWMHALTLFLASLALSLRRMAGGSLGDFVRGAGFWAGILIVFHVFLSLPIFGNEFTGIFVVKYQPSVNELEQQSATLRFLSGGAGGPLSSFAVQLLLLLQVYAAWSSQEKKSLLNRLFGR